MLREKIFDKPRIKVIKFNHIFIDYDDITKLYEQSILRYIHVDTSYGRFISVGYTHELLAVGSFTALQ